MSLTSILSAAAPFAPVIGSALSGAFSAKSAQRSINAQERSLKNKHQWEVADLKAAGLNPILSAHGSGGGISGAQASIPDLGNSARQALRLDAEIELLNAQTRGTTATAINTEARNPMSEVIHDSTKGLADIGSGAVGLMKNLFGIGKAKTARGLSQLPSNRAKQSSAVKTFALGEPSKTRKPQKLTPAGKGHSGYRKSKKYNYFIKNGFWYRTLK